MRVLKAVLAVIAAILAFDNLDRGQYRITFYWMLVTVYWTLNVLGA